jgi:ubiquitin C-terminal hydrolase
MIKCTNCGRISLREEDYYDISLPIKGKKDIRDSLTEFVEIEVLKDGNAYHCEKYDCCSLPIILISYRCNSKQAAEKSVKFKTLPEVLNIQLKR